MSASDTKIIPTGVPFTQIPNALILDPYAGTGTTLQVASGHGFSSIGIDLDERNTQLAEKRIGMFLEMRS